MTAQSILSQLECLIADYEARQRTHVTVVNRLKRQRDKAMGVAREYKATARRYQREMLEAKSELKKLLHPSRRPASIVDS